MLDLGKLFFDLGNMIAICDKKLSLVLFDYVFNFVVHLVDCFMQLFVGLENWLVGVIGDKGAFMLFH